MMRILAFCALVGLSGPLFARTIALWPMELDPDSGVFDGKCAVNPDFGLYFYDKTGDNTDGIEQGVGWNLPPNPEPESAMMFLPVNRTAVKSFRTDAEKGLYPVTAPYAALQPYICSTNSFTVEGFIRFDRNPSQSSGEKAWCVIVQSGNGSFHRQGGWILSWRGDEGARKFWLTVPQGANDEKDHDKQIGPTIDSAGEADLINAWHHLALTHAVDASSSIWRLYIDGVEFGCAEKTVCSGISDPQKFGLRIGGRDDGNNRLNASFDYWRVSDKALSPEEFLCAGEKGTIVPAEVDMSTDTTVAYWKLGKNADGSLDTWDYVGTANLHGGFMPTSSGQAITNAWNTVLVPAKDSAFSGSPPNPTAALRDAGNHGSLLARHHDKSYTALGVPGLGSLLEPATCSFTVEGYFKPRRRENTETQWLFATRDNMNGWGLQLQNWGGRWSFALTAEDKDESLYNPSMNALFSADVDLSDWVDWKHLALVYEAGAGSAAAGQWRCYLDGELIGAIDSRVWVGTTDSKSFYIGGRRNAFNNFCGWIDCVRVSGAALSPEQFLCTPGGSAATDVLAYWPLDMWYGSFDGKDLTGNYTLQQNHGQAFFPVASSDMPTIANRDRSPRFDGNSACLSGSARFRDSEDSRKGASFETGDPNVCSLFNAEEYTFECYFKIDSKVSQIGSNWDCIFLTPSKIARFGDWVALHQIFSYLPGTGFRIEDQVFGNSIHVFEGTGDQPADVWRHLALTRSLVTEEGEEAERSVYRLYLDGVLSGEVKTGQCRSPNAINYCLRIGGRPDNVNNTWRGCLSSIRVSKGVLAPSRFLCAAPEVAPAVPPAPKTIIYWPFDSVSAAPSVASSFGPLGFTFRDWTAETLSGCAETARSRVPAPVTEFSRANTGSVALEAGAVLRAPALGERMTSESAFTVEGWLKWDGAERGGEIVICGSYDADTNSSRRGWKLFIDDTGDVPRFGVHARCGRGYTPMTAGLFSGCAARPGEWQYVALSCDPAAGNRGVWTLTVDNRRTVSVENIWRDAKIPAAASSFRFGAPAGAGIVGFSGMLDMWRVSSGVRGGEELLYRKSSGASIVIR